MNSAWIALGGNLGNVRESFDSAILLLAATCTIIKKSNIYQTPAIGPLNKGKPQPDYLNAAVHVTTKLSNIDLLSELHRIEAKHDRKRIEHWGARTLDLDLLAYNNDMVHSDKLMLPHPQIAHRLFVLQPLADIAPHWIHPESKQSVSRMMQALQEDLFTGLPWHETTHPT